MPAVRPRQLTIALAVVLLLAPVPLHAQASADFVRGVADFINAAEAPSGDQGAALTAAVDAMTAGLAAWDAAIGKVEEGFNAAVSGAPPPAASRMRLAIGAVYFERGSLDAALEMFAAASALDPATADPELFRGLTLERAGRLADAAAAFNSAWRRDPSNTATAYRFLRARLGAGPQGVGAAAADAAAALASMRAALDKSDRVAPALTLQGIDLLDDAASPVPIVPFAAHAEAFALLQRGRYQESLARFRAAVAPAALGRFADERTRLAAADARIAAGDPLGARQALLETVKAFPDSPRAQWKLGSLLQSINDQRGAVEALERASPAAVAGRAPLLASIGRIHHGHLDLDAAVAAYSRRVAVAPNDSAAHYDLATVYVARDDLNAAQVEALAAALIDPKGARAYAMLGQLDASAGRDEDAVRVLRTAVSLDPADRESRYALGRALLRVGREDEARAELAVFEKLQAAAMEEERRRFDENSRKIEETLKAIERREPAR